MIKEIYNADAGNSSFYDYHSFTEFLSSQGAQNVMANDLHTELVYWLDNHNVMLCYQPHQLRHSTILTLFGDEPKIGEVEKIILEAAKAHDSKNSAKPASP